MLRHGRRRFAVPFLLAIGVLGALRDAIRGLHHGGSIRLPLPATNVLRAVAG